MDDERQTDEWPAGMTGRGLRGRRLARLMIVIAIVLPVMLGALLLSAPSGSGGPWNEPPDPTLPAILLGVGIFAYVVGLAWMVRIYRADPEAHESFWRSNRN